VEINSGIRCTLPHDTRCSTGSSELGASTKARLCQRSLDGALEALIARCAADRVIAGDGKSARQNRRSPSIFDSCSP
jgi:hypothetical protein